MKQQSISAHLATLSALVRSGPMLAQAGPRKTTGTCKPNLHGARVTAVLELMRGRGRGWGLLAQYEEGRMRTTPPPDQSVLRAKSKR